MRDTWQKGHVYLGSLERKSAHYLAGYVTKKMTDKSDARLQGRHPEFCRMSLRPGIGGDSVSLMAKVLVQYPERLQSMSDVPGVVGSGKSQLPVGRYLHGRLREAVGRAKHAPQAVMDELAAEMLPLRLDAKNSEENPSFKARIVARDAGRINSLEARAEIFRQRRRV